MPYSLSLRRQALQALAHPQTTIKQVAQQFGLSRATLHTWLKRTRQNGDRGLLDARDVLRRVALRGSEQW